MFSKSRILIFLLAAFMLAIALPVMAQDTGDDVADLETIEITISGTVEFIVATDGTTVVTVGGVVVTASDTFNPLGLIPGSYVEITGVLQDDNSIMVISVNFMPEETETPEPEETETPEPEETETPEPETTEEAPVELGNCVPETHPIANRIANAYGVDVTEVIAMHCAGNGFGNIARAFLLAEAAENEMAEDDQAADDMEGGITAEDAWMYLDLHGAGMGWGQIVQESGVHPSELAPGRLRNRNADDTTEDGSDLETQSTGNNGNNGRGNGNNGNNGNNGRGNGNNGNNGNNGRGNGNGNGRNG